MTTDQGTRLDLAAMRQALHEGDADAMLALYAEDAEIEVVDQANPPSAPTVISGHTQIGAMYGDVFERDMTHELTRAVTDGQTAAYQVRCRYADGTRVVLNGMADLRDGRIVREEVVQAWDG